MQKQTKLLKEYDLVITAPFGSIGIYSHGMQVDIDFLSESVSIKSAPSKIAVQIASQIEIYLSNPNANFNLPVVFKGTPFQRKVWAMIGAIPSGQTRTYGELAEQLGSGPRAVANACGANHLPLIVPCHRVVAKTGLGGFMRGMDNGLKVKKWLLRHEGAINYKGALKAQAKSA